MSDYNYFLPDGADGRGGIHGTKEQYEAAQLAIAQRDKEQLNKGLRRQDLIAPKDGELPTPLYATLTSALAHGVEGYTPLTGNLATIDPLKLKEMESHVSGYMDQTLKNLTMAHYEVFGTWPDFSLSADILEKGDVEFETLDEAIAFFRSVRESYSGTGSEWKVEASGQVAPGQQTVGFDVSRNEHADTWSKETDVLDPEMIASFRPKSVEDFIAGPYMKRSIEGKSTMFRDGTMRLDEMLVALPKQWAISNLAGGLETQLAKGNTDVVNDERLMVALNQYIAARVPVPELRPAPTGAWQNKTEEGLRYLQMMRASAIYVANKGVADQDPEKAEQANQAASFLSTQGYNDLIGTLDEAIGRQAMPSGSTNDAQRKLADSDAAWVQQMWVATRNPGVSERMALHQLHDVNPNATTLETQKQVGHDQMMSRAGMLVGWMDHVPLLGEVKEDIAEPAFRALKVWVPAIVGDIMEIVEQTPIGPTISAMGKFYEERNLDLTTLRQSTASSRDWGVSQVLTKLLWGVPGLVGEVLNPGQDEIEMKARQVRAAAFAEYVTVYNKQHPNDPESVSSFVDKWRFYHQNNQKAKDAGVPMQYTDELMRDAGINPADHKEMSFVLGFAFDTALDGAIFKGLGVGYQVARATSTFRAGSRLAATTLHVNTVGQVAEDLWKQTSGLRPVSKTTYVKGAKNVAGQMKQTSSKGEFGMRMTAVFGFHQDDVTRLAKALEKGVKMDGKTRASSREIIDDAIKDFTDPGKAKRAIYPDQWAIFEQAKAKALYDPTSYFWRGHHPYVNFALEKTYNIRKFSLKEDNVFWASQEVASRTRLTALKLPGGMQEVIGELKAIARSEHNHNDILVLEGIEDSGDLFRVADYLGGKYLFAREDEALDLTKRFEVRQAKRIQQLKSTGNTVLDPFIRRLKDERFSMEKGLLDHKVQLRRDKIAEITTTANKRLLMRTPASKRFAAALAKKDKRTATLWKAHVREMSLKNGWYDENGEPLSHIPKEAQRRAEMNMQLKPQDRLPLGIIDEEELAARGMVDFTDPGDVRQNPYPVMAPEQEPGIKKVGGEEIPFKQQQETSRAFHYDVFNEMVNEETMKLDRYRYYMAEYGILSAEDLASEQLRFEAKLQRIELMKDWVASADREADFNATELFNRSVDLAAENALARASQDAALILGRKAFRGKNGAAEYDAALKRLTAKFEESVTHRQARLKGLYAEAETMRTTLKGEFDAFQKAGATMEEALVSYERDIADLEDFIMRRTEPSGVAITRSQLIEQLQTSADSVLQAHADLTSLLDPVRLVLPIKAVDTVAFDEGELEELARLISAEPGITEAQRQSVMLDFYASHPDRIWKVLDRVDEGMRNDPIFSIQVRAVAARVLGPTAMKPNERLRALAGRTPGAEEKLAVALAEEGMIFGRLRVMDGVELAATKTPMDTIIENIRAKMAVATGGALTDATDPILLSRIVGSEDMANALFEAGWREDAIATLQFNARQRAHNLKLASQAHEKLRLMEARELLYDQGKQLPKGQRPKVKKVYEEGQPWDTPRWDGEVDPRLVMDTEMQQIVREAIEAGNETRAKGIITAWLDLKLLDQMVDVPGEAVTQPWTFVTADDLAATVGKYEATDAFTVGRSTSPAIDATPHGATVGGPNRYEVLPDQSKGAVRPEVVEPTVPTSRQTAHDDFIVEVNGHKPTPDAEPVAWYMNEQGDLVYIYKWEKVQRDEFFDHEIIAESESHKVSSVHDAAFVEAIIGKGGLLDRMWDAFESDRPFSVVIPGREIEYTGHSVKRGIADIMLQPDSPLTDAQAARLGRAETGGRMPSTVQREVMPNMRYKYGAFEADEWQARRFQALYGDILIDWAERNVGLRAPVRLLDEDAAWYAREAVEMKADDAAADYAVKQAQRIGEQQIVDGGDIFDKSGIPVVPTNMQGTHGKGVALTASDRKGGLGLLRDNRRKKGEYLVEHFNGKAVPFPTKVHWREVASIKLIRDSFAKFGEVASNNPHKTFLLPPVGMGLGQLSVEEVGPLIRNFLAKHPNVKLYIPADFEDAARLREIVAGPLRAPITDVFEIVGKGKGDFDGMRGPQRQHMNTPGIKPGDKGWLGNPHLANDVRGGTLTREEAVAAFKVDFLAKVESDPIFREAVLALRGKKVGYYMPGAKSIHLQVVQDWLREQAGKAPAAAPAPAPRAARPILFVHNDPIFHSLHPGRRIAAQMNHTTGEIRYDRIYAAKQFAEKSWAHPRTAGIEAFPEDAFRTFDDWENFILEHEMLHVERGRLARDGDILQQLEARVAEENAINRIAYERVMSKDLTPHQAIDSQAAREAFAAGPTRQEIRLMEVQGDISRLTNQVLTHEAREASWDVEDEVLRIIGSVGGVELDTELSELLLGSGYRWNKNGFFVYGAEKTPKYRDFLALAVKMDGSGKSMDTLIDYIDKDLLGQLGIDDESGDAIYKFFSDLTHPRTRQELRTAQRPITKQLAELEKQYERMRPPSVPWSDQRGYLLQAGAHDGSVQSADELAALLDEGTLFTPYERPPTYPEDLMSRRLQATEDEIRRLETNRMSADELLKLARSPENRNVAYTVKGKPITVGDARQRIKTMQREVADLKRRRDDWADEGLRRFTQMKYAEQQLENARALLNEGVVRPITADGIRQLKAIASTLGEEASVKEVREDILAKMEEIATTLYQAETNPELLSHLYTEASGEWQLKTWHYSGYNYSKLSKFIAGGPIWAMERFNSRKLFGKFSIDDATTLYKTIVMFKLATMLRIPLADEFVRMVVTERINPIQAWREAGILRNLDILPSDIQFKMSGLLKEATDGTYSWIDINAKDAGLNYVAMATQRRRDPTVGLFLAMKREFELDPDNARVMMRDEIETMFKENRRDEKNLRKLIDNYRKGADEALRTGDTALADELLFKAWYGLGYRKGGALRTTGIGSHRFVTISDEGLGGGGAGLQQVSLQTKPKQLYQSDLRPGGKAHEIAPEEYGVKGDAQGLIDSLYHTYNYYYEHPILGHHWRPTEGWLRSKTQERWASEMRQGRIPRDLRFGVLHEKDKMGRYVFWNKIRDMEEGKPFTDWRGRTIVPDGKQVERWRPMQFGQRIPDGENPTILHSARDLLYGVLDYAGAKMNEGVYSHAFLQNFALVKEQTIKTLGRELTEEELTQVAGKAHFTARRYMERVMFTNTTYGGEEFLRNIILFLPAYRQFATYWFPYLAKHPFALSVVYRMNKDKEGFKVGMGPFEFDFSRMSFLINQSDNMITGWLPSGAPLLTMPVSFGAMVNRDKKSNIWGNLAGRWPFEFAGEFSALHSPFDKVIFAATGKTLPWPFGSDHTKNLWRAMQIQREALINHDKKISGGDAMWILRKRRLVEGLWNFISPVGTRIIDDDVESLIKGKQDYNKALTPDEVKRVLERPGMDIFKTFLEWENLPAYEKLDYLTSNPQIIPYVISGFTAGTNASGEQGLLYTNMAEQGIPDPDAYIARYDSEKNRLNKIMGTERLRKQKMEEEGWWKAYKSLHANDHDISRLQNEYEMSEGAFAPGGALYLQGRRGLSYYNDQLNVKFAGITDPFTGIGTGRDFDSDAYRYAKFMDSMGGAGRAKLQMSPNYEMYVLAKYQEKQNLIQEMLKNYVDRRMTTRFTPSEIVAAGYTAVEAQDLQTTIKSIDKLWDSADAASEKVGGYTTTEGRALRKQALEAQNNIIQATPLNQRFFGDNIAAMYSSTYLTTPSYARGDYVDLNNMDDPERQMFNHLTQEVDPDTGAQRLDTPFNPQAVTQHATIISYAPLKDQAGTVGKWTAVVDIGGTRGVIETSTPPDAGSYELGWKEIKSFFIRDLTSQPPTMDRALIWRKQLDALDLPQWAKDIIDEDVRAASWKVWLDAATVARRILRDTPNEYYGDAPGYSTQSKFGKKYKDMLLQLGNTFAAISPGFMEEWNKFNGDNEMVNSILGWYL